MIARLPRPLAERIVPADLTVSGRMAAQPQSLVSARNLPASPS
jgi:hypothetical protein